MFTIDLAAILYALGGLLMGRLLERLFGPF
jgi:hypothetical protein